MKKSVNLPQLCEIWTKPSSGDAPLFKLFKTRLRLHDDEGWRIEIKQLPELTDIGSNRCFDPIGDKCIWPQFGSGPERNDGAGSGFVSQEEYVEILEYAYDLGIRVVPEIVAPSHAAAAVQARDRIILL